MHGEKLYKRLWFDNHITEISEHLLQCNDMLPKEIHRRIRGLGEIAYWKGTEFRTLLLYVAVVVLKKFLPIDEYQHFLKLVCAVTICSTNKYRDFLPKARELFNEFIEENIDIYGIHSVSYNVHNLCHIVDDVEKFGELYGISAYPFENFLYQIKLMVKKCRYPLVQVARRLSEQKDEMKLKSFDNVCFEPQLKHRFEVLDSNDNNSTVFKELIIKAGTTLSNKKNDCWFLTTENEIVSFQYALFSNGEYIVTGSPLKTKEDFFKNPFSSRYINIYKSKNDKESNRLYKIFHIKAKLFCMPYENEYVFFPLLHTL